MVTGQNELVLLCFYNNMMSSQKLSKCRFLNISNPTYMSILLCNWAAASTQASCDLIVSWLTPNVTLHRSAPFQFDICGGCGVCQALWLPLKWGHVFPAHFLHTVAGNSNQMSRKKKGNETNEKRGDVPQLAQIGMSNLPENTVAPFGQPAAC